MKNWYKSAPAKIILLAVQHVLVVLVAVSLIWLVAYPGITQDIISSKDTKEYEATQGFGEEVSVDAHNALFTLMDKEQLETDGRLDEDKIIDTMEATDNNVISGENSSGLAYRLGDLIEWYKRRNSGELEGAYYGMANPIIVCEKQGGGYHYYYYEEFSQLVESGELSFLEEPESGVTQQNVLDWLREGSFYQGATGWSSEAVVDKNNQIQYRSFWNYDGCWMEEAYAPVDAENILDVANNDPEWNGKLNEAFERLDGTISWVYTLMQGYDELKNSWQEGNTNFTYLYADTEKKLVYTNRKEFEDFGKLEESIDKLTSDGRYALVKGKLADFKSNINGASARDWTDTVTNIIGREEDFVYVVNVDTEFPIQDAYYTQNEQFEQYGSRIQGVLIMGALAFVGIIVTFVWLTIIAGRRAEDSDIHLNPLDRIKTEIMAVVAVGSVVAGLYLFSEIYSYAGAGYYGEHGYSAVFNITTTDIIAGSVMALAACFIFMTAYLSLVRQFKAKILWKNSLIKWLAGLFMKIIRHMNEIWRTLLAIIGIIFINLLGLIAGTSGFGVLVLLMLAADAAAAVYLIYQAVGRHMISKGIERISKGEVNYKIPLMGLRGGQREIAEKVNSIGEGLDAAVEASMKNERLKTDLITNVSHDIKTPLTSIINYVDLLKRENFKDPKIQGYLDILEAKAQRLKTLTEDVVEASKVSSGNISLEYMDINLTEMIQQTSGEFEEKFSKRHLKEVLSLPETPAIIRVDGRRMWRVLENIYNNAAKYAMEGTRIYADLTATESKVTFSLKNISEQPLNIQADELTERFIRGDVSRSTEGSGLGLSIAKSLTTMQGGTFDLYLDGDLFKVTITFPQMWKSEKGTGLN